MKICGIGKIAISMGLLIMSTSVSAQTPNDRAAVERAALNYLEGFYEGSTDKIRQSVPVRRLPRFVRNGARCLVMPEHRNIRRCRHTDSNPPSIKQGFLSQFQSTTFVGVDPPT